LLLSRKPAFSFSPLYSQFIRFMSCFYPTDDTLFFLRYTRSVQANSLRDALTAQAVKIIFDAGVLRSEIQCDEALFLFRNRRLRPGVIHRMHGFRRRFFIQQQRQKINHRGSASDGVLFQRQLRKGGQSIRQCRRQLHSGDIGTFRIRIREKWQRYKFHCVFWSVL